MDNWTQCPRLLLVWQKVTDRLQAGSAEDGTSHLQVEGVRESKFLVIVMETPYPT